MGVENYGCHSLKGRYGYKLELLRAYESIEWGLTSPLDLSVS